MAMASPTPQPRLPASLPISFLQRKARILASLAVPAQEYDDLSPKGSIDEGIRNLIDEINGVEGWVTTSSCAGRVSVFAEGEKRARVVGDDGHAQEYGEEEDEGDSTEKKAAVGGKGGGGKWLFVSHEPVIISRPADDPVAVLGLQQQEIGLGMNARNPAERRLVHFKFEAMILHILTASLSHAQTILSAALQAGFRESGALNLTSDTSDGPTPMVAVRSTGLGLDSVIGDLDVSGAAKCAVSREYLDGLVAVANERFMENSARIARFRELLLASGNSGKREKGAEWEDASARRERKRAEGLKRSEELRQKGTRRTTIEMDYKIN